MKPIKMTEDGVAGGQGRSAYDVRDDGVGMIWIILALVAVLILATWLI